jgi:hypothetical protein
VSGRRLAYVALGTLLVASAVAFVRAEQLKLRRGPVGAPAVGQIIAPGCDRPRCRQVARLAFRLRVSETIGVSVVDDSGDTVRRLVRRERRAPGVVRLRWDGSTDAGGPAPDGRYRLRVDLASRGRAITIPDPIVLDTVPPVLTLTGVERRGGTPFTAELRVQSSEPARIYLVVRERSAGGAPGAVVRGSIERVRHGRVEWRAGGLAAGRYVLELVASDRAGNPAPDRPAVAVTVP